MSSSTPFPLYLLPSLPFRRRSSTSTTSPTSTPSTSPPHPTSFLSPDTTPLLRCHKCLTDLAPTTSIISKGFTGRHGRAYLVSPPSSTPTSSLLNITTHKPVARQLVTGAHTVCDISCRGCGVVLGWKYVAAEQEEQRYKVGKFILETKRVVREGGWEGGEQGEREGYWSGEEEEVQFDSQDEDECEDLFAGVWSVGLARRRRGMRGRGFEDGE